MRPLAVRSSDLPVFSMFSGLLNNLYIVSLVPFAKARKRIDTFYSQLTDLFGVIRNYAKITTGLFAGIIGKINALTVLQYVNFIDNKTGQPHQNNNETIGK